MTGKNASFLQFLNGQEICQIGFGPRFQPGQRRDFLPRTGVLYEPSEGAGVVWTEGHPFDAVPVLRLKQTIKAFDKPIR